MGDVLLLEIENHSLSPGYWAMVLTKVAKMVIIVSTLPRPV
jgi:hypothetical protein